MTAPKNGKTGSRNPAKKPTAVGAWKKTALAPLLELPSGNVIRIKKVGMQALLKAGLMPNSLMSFAQKAVGKGTGQPAEEMSQEDMAEIMANPERIAEISDAIDSVTIFVAQEPRVFPLPDEGVERDEELLYIDEVEEEDKIFIFQAVTGGTTEVETFRAEHSAGMAAIHRLENVELPSE